MLGPNLHDFMKEEKLSPLPREYIQPVLHQILMALCRLKQLEIIHTDLKPENIVIVDPVQQPLRVKVIDFGCARQVSGEVLSTYLQTRWYRSPEFILDLPFCEVIDRWSLGCVAAELFLVSVLYPGSSEYEQLRYITDTQGLPGDGILNKAITSTKFFHQPIDSSRSSWQLKTPEEYQRQTGRRSQERREYRFQCLEDIAEDDFPGVRQGDADNSETLEPSPGPSSFPGNKSSDEDDVDGTYAVRGAPLPDWLNVDGEVFEEPLHDPDLSFLEDV
ncbi:hypothetical protein MTO96_051966 [Rhipicephalus appendiculatus]